MVCEIAAAGSSTEVKYNEFVLWLSLNGQGGPASLEWAL